MKKLTVLIAFAWPLVRPLILCPPADTVLPKAACACAVSGSVTSAPLGFFVASTPNQTRSIL